VDFLSVGPSDSEMECTVKPRVYVLVYGLVIPVLDCKCTVKLERLGGTQIPHVVGGELRWHLH